MIAYEKRLDGNLSWALREGSMHFEKESSVHKALKKIVNRLDALGVSYAVVGGMAMFFHGYRRFTEDVDILVTRDGLQQVHDKLEGLGYVPPFAGSKQLRDAELGVRIEFLVSGEFPGDGKPKAIAFPDPKDVGTPLEGVQCLKLPRLIELKLASGMSNPRRAKDLVDVQEMIEKLDLPANLAEELDPSVREKYGDIWNIVHSNPA
jgi:hypothetical protein